MKASKAQNEGRFKDEITPVVIPSKKGDIIFENDEYIKHDANLDKIKALKPAFKKDGTVSAGSSSGINDGASAIILMSKELADKKGIKPLATIVSHASAGVDPSIMGIGPVPSSQKALRLAGLTIDDIDLVEANEAFASQSIAVARELKLDPKKVNVNGGAIALGHPIGASGARILTTLIHEMIKRESKYGLATLCIGGGMGEAVIIKR
jgi:acetyl-CoA C-acetyltransferase